MVAKSQEEWAEIANSEYRAVMSYCQGNGVDVCCGSRVFPGAVGVDLVPRNEETQPWGNKSAAQLCFDCMDLPFRDDTLDFVVAIHAIEHFVDTEGALREWLRVLRAGGHLCLVVPDAKYTPAPGEPDHDFTHFREYDPDTFRPVVESVTGLEVVQYDTLSNRWSFDCVARKVLSERGIGLVDDIVDEYSENMDDMAGSGAAGQANNGGSTPQTA